MSYEASVAVSRDPSKNGSLIRRLISQLSRPRQFHGQIGRHECIVDEERLVDGHALAFRQQPHALEQKRSHIAALHALRAASARAAAQRAIVNVQR